MHPQVSGGEEQQLNFVFMVGDVDARTIPFRTEMEAEPENLRIRGKSE